MIFILEENFNLSFHSQCEQLAQAAVKNGSIDNITITMTRLRKSFFNCLFDGHGDFGGELSLYLTQNFLTRLEQIYLSHQAYYSTPFSIEEKLTEEKEMVTRKNKLLNLEHFILHPNGFKLVRVLSEIKNSFDLIENLKQFFYNTSLDGKRLVLDCIEAEINIDQVEGDSFVKETFHCTVCQWGNNRLELLFSAKLVVTTIQSAYELGTRIQACFSIDETGLELLGELKSQKIAY